MARKPTGRPRRPKTTIERQKFEFGSQINATQKEICRWLNVSETPLDALYSAHYHEMVTASPKRLTPCAKTKVGWYLPNSG
jgi:hypothetical protein